MILVIRPSIAILAISMLCACSTTSRIDPEPKTDGLPTVTKLPVHAGVYYSPQFANQEHTRIAGKNTYVTRIGPANVRLFDDMLPRVFEKTTRISKLSADEYGAKHIDVVVVPSLEHFDVKVGVGFSDSDRYSISYRTTLYTNRGVPVASWLVNGKARDKPAFGLTAVVENNMIDAAAKFLQDFERNAGPALAAMAKQSISQTNPVDLGSVVLTATRSGLPNLDPKVATALGDAGVVAVRLTAHSTTDRRLVMRSSDARLQLKDGLVVEPSSVSSVLSLLEETSESGAVTGTLTVPMIGMLVESAVQASRDQERELQSGTVGQSLFLDRTLSTGKDESGIVPFIVPKGKAAAEGMALTVWVVDPVSADGAQIKIDLSTGSSTLVPQPVAKPSISAGPEILATQVALTSRAHSADSRPADELPMAGASWQYAYTMRGIGGKSYTFSVRVTGVEGGILREIITTPSFPEQIVSVSADSLNFRSFQLPQSQMLVDLAPYLHSVLAKNETRIWSNLAGYPAGNPVLPPWTITVREGGQEEVTVPAGTFTARKIEVTGRRQIGGNYPFHLNYESSRFVFHAWYAPKVKRYAKLQHETWSLGGVPSGVQIVELTSYTAK